MMGGNIEAVILNVVKDRRILFMPGTVFQHWLGSLSR